LYTIGVPARRAGKPQVGDAYHGCSLLRWWERTSQGEAVSGKVLFVTLWYAVLIIT